MKMLCKDKTDEAAQAVCKTLFPMTQNPIPKERIKKRWRMHIIKDRRSKSPRHCSAVSAGATHSDRARYSAAAAYCSQDSASLTCPAFPSPWAIPDTENRWGRDWACWGEQARASQRRGVGSHSDGDYRFRCRVGGDRGRFWVQGRVG